MSVLKLLTVTSFFFVVASGHPSAVEVVQDIYSTCLKQFSVSCVKPKALNWMHNIADQPVIKITEDLEVHKTADQEAVAEVSKTTKKYV